MKKIVLPVAAAVLAVMLAGCVPAGTAKSPEAPSSSESPVDEVAEPSFAPEPEPAPDPGNLAFGDVMTWEDGLALSVSTPVPFTPGEYAAGGGQAHNVMFTFTVTNGSTENYEDYVYTTVTSGGAAGESIYDSGQGLSGPPSGVILPGQTISWTEGWSVADPNAIVLSTAPGFDYEGVIFTNVPG